MISQDVLPQNKLKRPTILFADDYAPFFAIWRRLLEPEFEVIGTVEDGQALIDVAIRLTPDIIVSDIGMPIISGFEALRQRKAIALAGDEQAPVQLIVSWQKPDET